MFMYYVVKTLFHNMCLHNFIYETSINHKYIVGQYIFVPVKHDYRGLFNWLDTKNWTVLKMLIKL